MVTPISGRSGASRIPQVRVVQVGAGVQKYLAGHAARPGWPLRAHAALIIGREPGKEIQADA
jgi:hypothetical protein